MLQSDRGRLLDFRGSPGDLHEGERDTNGHPREVQPHEPFEKVRNQIDEELSLFFRPHEAKREVVKVDTDDDILGLVAWRLNFLEVDAETGSIEWMFGYLEQSGTSC